MNPFTSFLAGRRRDKSLAVLIERCDALEELVIRVFKGKVATAEDVALYAELRRWFEQEYGEWEERLRPHWQGRLAGGKPVSQDPVRSLIAAAAATDFVGNWVAMQQLPALRETLNHFIVTQP